MVGTRSHTLRFAKVEYDGVVCPIAVEIGKRWFDLVPSPDENDGGHAPRAMQISGTWYDLYPRSSAPAQFLFQGPTPSLSFGDTDVSAMLKNLPVDAEELDLSHKHLRREHVEEVVALAESFGGALSHLDMSFCTFESNANALGARVAGLVSRSASLRTLNLSHLDDIARTRAPKIVGSLKRNAVIGYEGAEVIAQALASQAASLTELDLGYNQIGTTGALKIGRALELNTKLLTLSLPGCNLGEQGCARIAATLRGHLKGKNRTLRKLDLSSNRGGRFVGEVFGSALQENSSLQVLYLDSNDIGDGGARHIAAALKVNSTLTDLSLAHNGLSDWGLRPFIDAREDRGTLVNFFVDGNELSRLVELEVAGWSSSGIQAAVENK